MIFFSRLFSFFSFFFPAAPAASAAAATADQLERSHDAGSVWAAVRTGDLGELQQILSENPLLVDSRGPVGETILHMACLYNSPKHKVLARFLMDSFPACVAAQYSGPEYFGENILHISIINQDFSFVRELLQKEPRLINAQATGEFFKKNSPCYYGETPLGFALCTNQWEIADFLLSAGADPFFVDGLGNNFLHLLVIHELPEIYTKFKEELVRRREMEQNAQQAAHSPHSLHPQQQQAKQGEKFLWEMENRDGFTPFTLTASIGNLQMFSYLLEERRQIQWRYGPVSCFLYPLQELDSKLSQDLALLEDGGEKSSAGLISSGNSPGALEILIKNAHTNLLMHPRILALIEQKWSRFAARIFFSRFLMVFLYLLFFTLILIIRESVKNIADLERGLFTREIDEIRVILSSTGFPPEISQISKEFLANIGNFTGNAVNTLGNSSDGGVVAAHPAQFLLDDSSFLYWNYLNPSYFHVGEFFLLMGACWKLWRECQEMWENSISGYFSASGSGFLENFLSLCFSVGICLVSLLHYLQSPWEAVMLAFSALFGWFYLFFFLLGFQKTGPFLIMIYQMLFYDCFRFLCVFLVFLMGFSQGFLILLDLQGFSGFFTMLQVCFSALLGDFQWEIFAQGRFTPLVYFLVGVYIVLVVILLLNLLIAQMGDTYKEISESSEIRWQLERARIIFAIESEMSLQERLDERNKYWTIVSGERFLQVLEVREKHFHDKDKTEKEKREAK